MKLETIRRFFFFAYGMSCGRLLYLCIFHFRHHNLQQCQGAWLANMVIGFILIMVQSIECQRREDGK